MSDTNKTTEGSIYRRSRAGLVLFSLIVIVYNFGGGSISSENGSFGGVSLIVGIKFLNTEFLEFATLVALLVLSLKFFISSNEVRDEILSSIGQKLSWIVTKKCGFKVSETTRKWYGYKFVLVATQGSTPENNRVTVFIGRKFYIDYLRSVWSYALEETDYLDYFIPVVLYLIAVYSVFWRIFAAN